MLKMMMISPVAFACAGTHPCLMLRKRPRPRTPLVGLGATVASGITSNAPKESDSPRPSLAKVSKESARQSLFNPNPVWMRLQKPFCPETFLYSLLSAAESMVIIYYSKVLSRQSIALDFLFSKINMFVIPLNWAFVCGSMLVYFCHQGSQEFS